MTFRQRALDFTFLLGLGANGEDGYETVTVTGLRSRVTIEKTPAPMANTAVIEIFGMDRSLMARLSRLGMLATAVRDNVVEVYASSETGGTSLAFSGGIWESWQDIRSQPDAALSIKSLTGLLAQMKPVSPTSYVGPVDVATILAGLASQMGYAFEGNGVSVILSNPYLPGTAREQAMAAADAADVYLIFDDERKVMAVLTKGSSRSGTAPLISPETGMVGYPQYAGQGIIRVKTVYNPAIRFMGLVEVKSSLTQANGFWPVVQLTHELDAQLPNGEWSSTIVGNMNLTAQGASG